MDLTNTLVEYVNSQSRGNKIGRYSSSKIWSMLSGYLEPEDYLKPEKLDFKSAYNVWNGTATHEQVEPLLKYLGYEVEVKVELPYNDFIVVGKCDAINNNEILEIKTGDTIKKEAKSWHEFQARLYCSLFDRPKAIIVQPVKNLTLGYVRLNEIGEVKRNDKWFAQTLEKLQKYHNELKKYENQADGNS